MEIIITERTLRLPWDALTTDQQAHMNKDFPSDMQHERTFFTNPACNELVLPEDLFFGPVEINGNQAHVLTIGGVAYLVSFVNDFILISLAIS